MKQGIHPEYQTTTYVCSCGNRIETNGTKGGEVHIELCNQCHPFYTGQQKFVDTGGRVQRFADKFGSAANATLEREAKAAEERRVAAEAAEAAKRADRDAKAAEKAKKAADFERNAPKVEEVADEAVADVAEVVEEAPVEVAAEVTEVAEEAVAEVAEDAAAE